MSALPGAGRLAENVVHFARVLRGAGLPIGPDRVLDALRALATAGLGRREDFYWTLATALVSRREHLALFDQAFQRFWRDPDFEGRMLYELLPKVEGRGQAPPPLAPRLAEAFVGGDRAAMARPAAHAEAISFDAACTFSPREALARKDFEQMTRAEWLEARSAVAALRLTLPRRLSRRYVTDARGHAFDPRASLRAALRGGTGTIPLVRRSRRWIEPPLVVLCDISGSMDRYSRMLLHFVHALANAARRVEVFVFGTRLTRITRELAHRDPDEAIAAAGSAVADWAGGTRIGACLAEFNRLWSRRVLGQGARVLLVSDGLDRDDAQGLAAAMQRLHNACRELVWVNPLLRHPGFEPRAAGIRAMLPHVDRFLPVHTLESLGGLAVALASPPQRNRGRQAAA